MNHCLKNLVYGNFDCNFSPAGIKKRSCKLLTAKGDVLRAEWPAVPANSRNTALFGRARQGMHSSHLCYNLTEISCRVMNPWVQQKPIIYWPAEQLSTDQECPWTVELIMVKKSFHTCISVHISTCNLLNIYETKNVSNKSYTEKEVLGRNNCLLPFDTTHTTYKTMQKQKKRLDLPTYT
jgi:hypothetical protein